GELVAMDRSIGTLRRGLRDLKIVDSTLFWFCSDNGGLPRITPGTVGGLRGFKGSVYEGGLRVPAIIEWPNGISKPRITNYPSCTMDIFPTLTDVANLPKDSATVPMDGLSLKPLFSAELSRRDQPIGFRHTNRTAFLDNQYKLINTKVGSDRFELYDLESDPTEANNIIEQHPRIASRLKSAWSKWNESIEASIAGKDYREGKVIPPDPGPRTWTEVDAYRPYLSEWKKRPEYRSRIK
ncbi:MAG TPA: N-acetylgalactosamine 6-sulfate sulfatase, partial [Fuerstia sp.]|nr:N-acetylgalactosamine 6-sulfate sulfatase [Fuerstiella sp.]